MIAFVHFARVAEVAVIKRVLQNERNARDVDAAISFGHHARVLQHRCESIECHISTRISLKHLAHEYGIFLVDANRFRAWVVQVADRSESRIYSLPRFLTQTASSIRAQLSDIFIRHTKLDGHHQHIVVRIMRAVVRFDMANYALLQKPLNLSTVHRISREAIYFPTNYSLRFARLYARHHIVEYRAARNLCGFLFNKFLDD